MFADYHVCTEFSDDSVYPMEQVVRDAIARGIDEICFTDHVDYGIKQDWDCGKPILYRGEEPLANVIIRCILPGSKNCRKYIGRKFG